MLVLCVALAGCEGVREDRTIEFSPQADAVGFQHGDQGVFVADKGGGGLKKVFQPGADVLATSTPLWSPKGRKLVFTTARAAEGDPAALAQAQAQVQSLLRGGSEPDPAGDVFVQVPVVYTCWLRDEESGEPPTKLFDAHCDHVGYVAANLAVRWHPQGDRVLYVDHVSSGKHAIFSYDLKTKASRRVFPHESPALIFDWSPDGRYLACVLGSTGSGTQDDGLWIGEPDANPPAWWHVPNSQVVARPESSSLLEQLRASRPAWTIDGGVFAFVTYRPGVAQSDPGESALWMGTLVDRRVEQVAHDSGRLHDLHWSPRGEKLGLVRSGPDARPIPPATPSSTIRAAAGVTATSTSMSTLHIWSRADGLSGPLNTRPVRRFAGWSASGDHLAYVAPDRVLGAESPLFSFLLVPDPVARDAVVLDDGQRAGQGADKPVFSGLRVTFPHWSRSKSDEVLSLWCTFSPSHRSVLSRFLGGGLRSGDPAALFDTRTGKLSWMAVSPLEETQIGHYHQIKRDFAEAWQRYERADRADADADGKAESKPPADPHSATEWMGRLFSPRGIAVFRFHCLTKLGKAKEAQAQLDQFRHDYPPQLPPASTPVGAQSANGAGFPFDQPWFREALRPGSICSRLLQDLYIAEVLLGVDASEDARDYFQSIIAAGAAESETARASAAVVLSQVLLLEQKHEAYAVLATETVAPLLLKLRRSQSTAQLPADTDLSRHLPDLAGGLALLPLTSKTFLSGLSVARVQSMAARWEALRGEANDDLGRLAADVVLEACYQQLGQEPAAATGGRTDHAQPCAHKRGHE